MTVNDGGFLNAVRDGSCTHVLNLLDSGGVDLEQRDQVSKKASCHKTHTKKTNSLCNSCCTLYPRMTWICSDLIENVL